MQKSGRNHGVSKLWYLCIDICMHVYICIYIYVCKEVVYFSTKYSSWQSMIRVWKWWGSFPNFAKYCIQEIQIASKFTSRRRFVAVLRQTRDLFRLLNDNVLRTRFFIAMIYFSASISWIQRCMVSW